MEQHWRFLVVNITYRDFRREVVHYVSANYRKIFSYAMKEELDNYLDQLDKEGWELTQIRSLNDGRDEAYYFRLPLV